MNLTIEEFGKLIQVPTYEDFIEKFKVIINIIFNFSLCVILFIELVLL